MTSFLLLDFSLAHSLQLSQPIGKAIFLSFPTTCKGLCFSVSRFLKSEIINTQFGYLYMPSTGALMLLTALHTCDQVTVLLFMGYYFLLDNISEDRVT